MKSILDQSFRYTPSIETDIRKTFARIRREQRRDVAPASIRQESAKLVQLVSAKRG
jgi:hypothetical protein